MVVTAESVSSQISIGWGNPVKGPLFVYASYEKTTRKIFVVNLIANPKISKHKKSVHKQLSYITK